MNEFGDFIITWRYIFILIFLHIESRNLSLFAKDEDKKSLSISLFILISR